MPSRTLLSVYVLTALLLLPSLAIAQDDGAPSGEVAPTTSPALELSASTAEEPEPPDTASAPSSPAVTSPAPARAVPSEPGLPTPASPATGDRQVDTSLELEEPLRAANSIYATGLGAGIYYSLNYERLVIQDLAVRIGFSYIPVDASATSAGGDPVSLSASLVNVPLSVSYLGVGRGSHVLEMGAGVTISYASASVSSGTTTGEAAGVSPFGSLFAGYRFHPLEDGGFLMRIGAMLLVLPSAEETELRGWGYLSMGASF